MHQQTVDKVSFCFILRAEWLMLELYHTTYCVALILYVTIMRQSINIFPMKSLLEKFLNAATKWEYLQFSLHFWCPFMPCYTNHSTSIAFCHSPTKQPLKLLELNALIRRKSVLINPNGWTAFKWGAHVCLGPVLISSERRCNTRVRRVFMNFSSKCSSSS
jgi:hypothetical protein